MKRTDYRSDRPRLLMVTPDRTTARRIVAALGRNCFFDDSGRDHAANVCHCARGGRWPCTMLVGSMAELRRTDLGWPDVVVCSSALPDGNGLDAVSHINDVRPSLPVILLGRPGNPVLAMDAIRAGACEFLTMTARDLPFLRLAVEKYLLRAQVYEYGERLEDALSSTLEHLADRNVQLETVIEQLQALARTDDLTRLCNRRHLDELLRRAWADAMRHDRPLAVLMIDLDGFKAVNDTLGHQRGDELLGRLARIIRDNCRTEDVAARYGGDEFCVLMPECSPRDAMQVARRILREYDQASRNDEPEHGVSIGVAHFKASRPESAERLLQHADEALYAAKSEGKRRALFRNADATCTPEPIESALTADKADS